ncbi:TetR/AcrR family transcriptional regulator [Streptomyces sp. NPDC001068]|uniref:TetR/AcrR family transcriptional regulator n=1 Tax=Streptomyces sp. NPDC001068 TaxID=3364544 RepID=UPI0036841F76
MTAKRASRLAPEQRRAQLLDIGLQLLTEQSPDELSTDEVARRAGISRGLLFHYFASKREFHEAIVRKACDELIAATTPDPSLDTEAWLDAAMSGFVDYVLANRTAYLTVVRGAPTGNPAVQEIVDETHRTLAGRVLAYHRRVGLPDQPHLDVVAQAWMALSQEATVNWPLHEPGARDELNRFLKRSLTAVLAVPVREESAGPARTGM